MTNEQHSITPPDELVEQWYVTADNIKEDVVKGIANRAVQWGWDQRGAATEAELQQRADQELEACCEWMRERGLHPEYWRDLRAARRPKSLSLNEQALDALQSMRISPELIAIINANTDLKDKYETIRCALETL